MPVNAKFDINLQATDNDALDLGGALLKHLLSHQARWPAGPLTAQVSEAWSDERTIVAAAHLNLDFSAGLPAATGDPRGAGVTFSKVKAIALLKTTDTDYIQIGGGTDGGAAADAFAGTDDYPFVDDSDMGQVVGEDGIWIWMNPDGAAVAAGASVFHIGAVTTDQTVKILIIGDA